ncbi:HD family phosphohydrolase [Leeuwenhoekiella parthenopeia]|uniref:HDIG domain-containing protein n=1 Tax=Leeuwenhoekiella parthenopeia TaxID=2890320 RepID=A0ABS8GWL1_9FLAO|nr:HDIG domain-containing metalloprotein [Leeuwenhoekiella parthenopeia]MCC4214384.1 HDIG domain-containing protein [Leeuwenhoekiella parthenopeia]
MSDLLNRFYKNQGSIYKVLLCIASTILIVYLFPKSGKFQFDFQQNKPWQYDNLYAPVDFAILKSDEQLEVERAEARDNIIPYFNYDQDIANEAKAAYENQFASVFTDSIFKNRQKELKTFGLQILDDIYKYGVISDISAFEDGRKIYLRRGNEVEETSIENLNTTDEITTLINRRLVNGPYVQAVNRFKELFYDIVQPNVFYDEKLTTKELNAELSKIAPTKGVVNKGSRIVAKGEIVEQKTYQILKSLQAEYESQTWTASKYNWVVFGYVLLVSVALTMLLLFIRNYREQVFENNTKVTFIFFNIILMVLFTTLIVKYDANYVYVVPLCILPLVIKAFFDARLGLFTHVIAILLLGFIVPNTSEYMFLQVIAGIVTILTVSELYKRANLFISVGQITFIYILGYFAFHIIHEGTIDNLEWETFSMFIITGLATLFVQPLIYAYEKIFGLVSDLSLLELTDTNSKLLKELANKAPGTFHHSLNVANLAEAAANEIGANSMLVRVGALYHDIGKMVNPTDFTENQSTGINTHEDLSPDESARIIIDHVLNGIEIARKNNLPDRVIDFIRTHHGTSTVYYFYKKAQEQDGEVNVEDFRYPGPLPFSKETAILMMSDSVEAASKSLKNPTSVLIDSFVEKIINKQMDENQFLNANITFKEIQTIKKVLKLKLNNIYHLRIEYPE